ncbi:MAG: thioredoxin domain-containing protein [Bacteriovoracaceae bacterium]|jgi:protein-disulfide isomerase|nr:thiol:disulfide interchange protein [Halobacteriovoraceae bacterium]MDP7319412.1 thioredoxin domain-containing protein [Bacteriovoracaceae bacterium]
MSFKLFLSTLLVGLFFVSCNPSEKQIGEMLKKNPKLITEAIKENPSEFIEALNEAVKSAQGDQRKKAEEAQKKQLEESFNNPLKPEIREDDVIRGKKGAPITLVEYSDFECPYCSRGYQTVQKLLEKYEGKIQFVYKHLPLSFHPNAMPAAQYYEAIRLQSKEKAGKFHDELFENFSDIKKGEKFFRSVAKKLNVDMKKLEKDVDSDVVKKRIQEDLDEAKKFGFQGTPGFLINGIPVKGAYPPEHFDGIIEELKKRGKLKL